MFVHEQSTETETSRPPSCRQHARGTHLPPRNKPSWRSAILLSCRKTWNLKNKSEGDQQEANID